MVFGVLLLRGVLGAASTTTAPSPPRPATVSDDQASESFVIRFARTYLESPSGAALAPFLAEGVRVGTGRPPVDETSTVAQAEVSGTEQLANGTAILTVACQLRDSRTLYVAVPITRSSAGEVAALGAPSIVAPPVVAGADPDQPQPLAGSDAGSIQALAEKFLPQYLAATSASDLSYFVAPTAAIQPLAGTLDFESISSVTQLGSGEGRKRSILVATRVTDPASSATYPVTYRLDLVKGARWNVIAVEGAVA